MLNRKEDLTSYLKGAYFFSIPSVTATGKRVYQDRYDREVNSYDISGSEEDAASDLLSFGGIELGFGSEFNISDNFALGAEVGLRLIWNNVDYSDSNNGGYSNESWSAELKSAYRFTYTALTLSFNL